MQAKNNDRRGWHFGTFTLDIARGALLDGDREIKLRPKSFEVLRYLVEHHGVLVSRGELLDAVWGNAVVTDGVLTQCLIDIRRALADRPPRLIKTVPRRGYIFDLPVTGADDIPAPSPRPAGIRARRLSAAAAVIAAGASVFYWGYRSSGPEAATGVVAESAAAARVHTAARAVPDNPSVAVLPFQDLSRDQDQRYFSDGLAEEILMSLATLPELRVIARTSSFSFRGYQGDLSTIAERLGVTHLLEGSVRASGDRLRIAARLVDTMTEKEIWSQSYDRDTGDALRVQGEIAASVANALELTLAADSLPGEQSQPAGDAYRHYMQGRFFYNRRGTGDIDRAERHYRMALEIDPQFGRAWAGLAAVRLVQGIEERRVPGAESEMLPAMGDAVEQALLYAPDSAEVQVRAAMYFAFRGDRQTAAIHRRRAQELGPNDPLTLSYTAGRLVWEGRLEEAIELQSRALDLDPLSRVIRNNLATHLQAAGRFQEAEAQYREAMELDPSYTPEYELRTAVLHILQGRFDEALEMILAWPEGEDRDFGLALVRHSLGDAAGSDAAFARLPTSGHCDASIRLAEVHAHRGRTDDAFRVMQEALEREPPGLHSPGRPSCLRQHLHSLRLAPFLIPLRQDPRWDAYFEAAAERL